MDILTFLSENMLTGRIGEIISKACEYYNVSRITQLTDKQKLDFLCATSQIDSTSLDEIVANSPEVMRTVKGHTFEVVFEKMMALNNITCDDIGGDSDVDLVVNGISTQLKTPFINGCSDDVMSYKTHKTHGAKSEQESMDYYHKVSDFADYLIGLVSYTPFEVVIIPKDELPTVPSNADYIQSPMYISIKQRNYINQFNRLNIYKQLLFPQEEITVSDSEILPLSANAISVKSEFILNSIYRPENFRIWDMNMRGFIRERSLRNLFTNNSIHTFPPTITGLERPEKSDLVLQKKNGDYVRFQVKGLTINGCTFSGQSSRIDCETQLSRGRVNDHPTQSRLYKVSDFEFVIIAMDPPYTNHFNLEVFSTPKYQWSYYCVPVASLKVHPTYTSRIDSHQYILYTDLLQFQIDENWLTLWN